MSSDPKKLKLCNVGFLNQVHYAEDLYIGVFTCKAIFFPGYRAVLVICLNKSAAVPRHTAMIMNVVKREAIRKFISTLHFKFCTIDPAMENQEMWRTVADLITEFHIELTN